MAGVPERFEGVTVLTKANVYFDGKVVSHTVQFADGSRKTVGLIYPGSFTFSTGAPEVMEIASVGVEESTSDLLPASFELHQNYPNPFNPETTIEFKVSSTAPVSIKVYDLVGREIAVLVNEVKQPGVYRISFDGDDLASGVYFYKMVTGDFSSVKKMNLLK